HLQNKWVLKLQDPGFGTRRYSDDAYGFSIASMASDGFIHVFPVKKDKTPRTGKVAGDSRK
ncbi:hypothetical protein, partial [Escherichia coli]|uniref:hypothetical protein n=1 Tax=Escherichia coli TaxID=562 RepID=UPI001A7E1A18